MKRLLLASVALLAAGCGHDYARSAAQIPVAPTIAAQPLPQVPNPPAPVAAAPAPQVAAAPAQASSRTDYSVPANWLCKPGTSNNPCEVNIDATIVKADGSTQLQKYAGNPNAPIDCFYVYPDRVA
jgi:hypothetical protein